MNRDLRVALILLTLNTLLMLYFAAKYLACANRPQPVCTSSESMSAARAVWPQRYLAGKKVWRV